MGDADMALRILTKMAQDADDWTITETPGEGRAHWFEGSMLVDAEEEELLRRLRELGGRDA